ncbi:DegT/DnrJ/EryC1/StrS family aminotransferase [Paenibacillus thermotolerans]|uniref:DegT/DnrJ/EryC1/StrS family aminotransferase n=1 Tax=Paenibacillus thermotolerans TaxID=3027807 RepID=UPI0023684907|nr:MULTISPECIES: DegT/DnrJ/EryC1/StrS family aminotransferase [unclassified Paenibacillus]
MRVPILDLSEQYLQLKNDILASIESVMENTHFILGANVRQLEQEVAAYSNVSHGIGVANGSDALHLSLLACGIEPGDEVITTAFSFFSTAGAIARVGAIPVFVDIDPKTYNLDHTKVEAAITKKTKAIIPVHLYGQVANMTEIGRIAEAYQLHIVEDAAQAIGAEHQGKKVGEFGAAACYSFFPTKNLGAYGDAGMVVTNNDNIAEKIRILRVHGSKPKYHHHVLGYNSRLDEMQAAILNVKFKYLDQWNEQRGQKAATYNRLFADNLQEHVVTPYVEEGNNHIYHQYTIRVDRRDELQLFLKENGVDTMVYYPRPLHLQPALAYLGYNKGDLFETERACEQAMSLPMFPELKEEQQVYVVDKIKEFFL